MSDVANREIDRKLAFRAAYVFMYKCGQLIDSDNLLILCDAMAPDRRFDSSDPAMWEAWVRLWQPVEKKAVFDAAQVVCAFLREEGDWGSDQEERWPQIRDSVCIALLSPDSEVFTVWSAAIDEVLSDDPYVEYRNLHGDLSENPLQP